MAIDMFLKLDGITGEAKDKVHGKEIDVISWSWGMSNAGSAHIGNGAGSGKVNVQDISVTKFIDSSSPQLMLACCKGTHFEKALITVRNRSGFRAISESTSILTTTSCSLPAGTSLDREQAED